MQSIIWQMVTENMETIVATAGSVVVILLFFPKNKIRKCNNDVTGLIIEYNKRKNTVNQKSKSLF